MTDDEFTTITVTSDAAEALHVATRRVHTEMWSVAAAREDQSMAATLNLVEACHNSGDLSVSMQATATLLTLAARQLHRGLGDA